MVVEAYMGQPFDHSHEKEAADYLLNEMQSRFHSRPESYFLLSNIIVDGSQLDFVILKPRGVIVVELKEIRDPFVASENGEWVSKGRVIATNHESPYRQVRNYREKFISYLKRNLNEITPDRDLNLRQVSSYVCISPRIHQDSKINFDFSNTPFFKVVGLDNISEVIDSEIKPGLGFDDQAYRKIIKLLGLKPMKESYLSDEFLVPYRRNNLFTGRTAELSKLHNLLSSEENKGKPVVITGIGGLGKTQLCVEYAYQFRSHYPNGVYWINASENLISQFAKIAEGLELRVDANLPGNHDDILARRFLKMISGTPDALMIFDNVIDFMVFYKPLLNEFLLISFKCNLLLTSRIFPDNFLEFTQLKLKPFPIGDAHNYVGRILRANDQIQDTDHSRVAEKSRGQISRLCDVLGNHPLALNLAANSIRQKNIDPAGYIQRLQVEGRIKTLDSYELKNYDTFITYSINELLESHWDGFTTLEKNILCFFTLFSDEEMIPEERLRRFLQSDEDVLPGYPDCFNDALQSLFELGLVQKTGFGQIRIHPLYKEFCTSKVDIVREAKKLILQNLLCIYSSPSHLEALVFTSGVAEIKEDLRICKSKMSSELTTGGYFILEELYQIILQDAKFLIDVSPEDPPGYVKQQIRNRAIKLDYPGIASAYEADLTINNTPWLCETYNSQKLSGRFVQEFIHDDSPVTSIKLTRDDRLLISGSTSGWICIWDADTGKLIDDVKTAIDIESIQISPNGEYAAVRQIPGAIFKDGDGYVLTFNPNIEIWNLKDHRKVFSKPDDANEVFAVLDDHTVLFGTDHGEMIVCRLSENEIPTRVTYQPSRIVNIKVSYSKVAVVHDNSVICILQKSDLKLLNTFIGPMRVYKDAAFLDNDKVLFGCFVNYTNFSISDFQFDPDKYDGSAIGSMVFWTVGDDEPFIEEDFSLDEENQILELRSRLFEPDSFKFLLNKFTIPKFVASSGRNCCMARCGPYFCLFKMDEAGVIEINMEGSTCFGVLNSGDSFFGFDTDAGREDPLCVMFSDAETYHPLIGHLFGVNEILATQDEKYLFSASDDGSIKMWDIDAFRKECAALEEDNNIYIGGDDANEDFGKINNYVISGDEKKIAAVTNKGFLMVFSAGSGELLLRGMKIDDRGDLLISSFSESGLAIIRNSLDTVFTFNIDTNKKVKYKTIESGLVNCVLDWANREVGLLDAREMLQPIGEEVDLESLKPWYKVVDVEKNEILYEVDSLYADIFSTKSGGYFISSERPGKICVFDLNSQKLLCELISNHDSDEAVVQFQMNNAGTILSVTYSTGVKEIYSLSTASCDFSNNYDHPEISWSFDNEFRLVSINAYDASYIWDKHKGVVLAKIPGHNQIQIAGSGRFLVSLDSFGILHFYDCVNFLRA